MQTQHDGLDAKIELAAINASLALADVFEGLDFADPSARPPGRVARRGVGAGHNRRACHNEVIAPCPRGKLDARASNAWARRAASVKLAQTA